MGLQINSSWLKYRSSNLCCAKMASYILKCSPVNSGNSKAFKFLESVWDNRKYHFEPNINNSNELKLRCLYDDCFLCSLGDVLLF